MMFFKALDVPENVYRPFVRCVRRMLGQFRLSSKDVGRPGKSKLHGHALNIKVDISSIAQHIGISRPTIYKWACVDKFRSDAVMSETARLASVDTCPRCGGPITDEMDECPNMVGGKACGVDLFLSDKYLFDNIRAETPSMPDDGVQSSSGEMDETGE